MAATNSDEINMVCCPDCQAFGSQVCYRPHPQPGYNTGLSDLKRNMGIDMVINPENATAVEISRLLRFPPAANIETFCRGRVELIGFRLLEEDFLVNRPSTPCRTRSSSSRCCSAPWSGLGARWFIPNGSFCAPGGR